MIRQVSTITLRHLSSSRGQQHHQRLLHSSTSSSKHQNCTAAICLASFMIATAAAEKGNGQQHSQCYTPTSTNNNNHRLNVVSKCEEAIASSSSNIPTAPLPSSKPLTRLQRLVYPHSYLPTPRLLTPQDTVFSYPQLTRGLIQRQKDEERLRNLLSSTRVVKLRTNDNNQEKQQHQQLLQELNTIIYGAGITSQVRQEFLIQFGCTGYTPDTLHHLVTNYANRGIIEIGAGHGQWARALHDYHYQKMNDGENNYTTATTTNEEKNSNNNGGQHPNHQTRHQTRHSWMLHTDKFIVAYDNKESLPLSSSMSNTNNSSSAVTAGLTTTTTTVPPPTQEEMKAYFFNNVHTVNNIEAVTKYAHGRVLLLVYPPPGPMAIDTVHAYINATTTTTTNSSTSNHHPNRKHHHHNQYHVDNESSSNNSSSDWRNDIVIYVGEGRGGANANDEFFDYFLGTSNTPTTTTTPTTTDNNDESSINSSWVLEKVMTVKSCPGGKGYEKLFILRRV